MKQFSISIIVLTYRKFDNLQRNIHSIQEQIFNDYEVIICDDGSDNFDLSYIKGCCEGLKNVSIIHNEKNIGTVKNFNKAIDHSKGKYIVPLAQDDVFFDKDTLQSIFCFFETYNCDAFTAMTIGECSGSIRPRDYERKLLKEKNAKKIWIRCAYANFISGSCTYYRREFLKKRGLFDEEIRLIEDYPMVMKLLNNGYIMPIMERPTIIYGENGITGSSTKPSQLLVKDNVMIYKKYIIPYIDLLSSPFNRRIIRWRKVMWERYFSTRRYDVKYADVLIWLAITRIKSKMKKGTDCNRERFSSMIRHEKRGEGFQ